MKTLVHAAADRMNSPAVTVKKLGAVTGRQPLRPRNASVTSRAASDPTGALEAGAAR
jgi:hypothetical protein